jgi:hypothetical protein
MHFLSVRVRERKFCMRKKPGRNAEGLSGNAFSKQVVDDGLDLLVCLENVLRIGKVHVPAK